MTNPTVKVPADEDAERGLIGAVLVLPELIDELSTRVKADDFYYMSARETWQAMVALREKGDAIDEITLAMELKSRGVVGSPTDLAWLTTCRNLSPDEPAAAMKYADKVREYAVRVRLMKLAQELTSDAQNLTSPVDSILAKHTADLEAIPGRGNASHTLAQLYGGVFDQYGKPEPRGRMSTGIPDLDTLLSGGLKGGKLYVPASRPGMGKTAVMLYMAHSLVGRGIGVGFVTMEMDADEVQDRLTSIDSRVPQVALRTTLTAEQQAALGRTHTKFTVTKFGNNFHLVYDANMTMERLRALCAVWARQGIRAVFVDYLQLLNSGGLFRPSERTAEVSYFSRSLKQIALGNNLAVVAAAQLNREIEKRADKKPILADLRESGSIEQDADVVAMLNRRGEYDELVDPRVLDIHIAKQRAGAKGTITAWLELETGRILDGVGKVNLNDVAGVA